MVKQIEKDILTNEEIEQLFGWTPYDDWDFVELGVGGYTVQDKVSFEMPPEEEDAVFDFLKKNPSFLIPLDVFHRIAPHAFQHLVRSDKEAVAIQELTPVDWVSWAIHAPEDLVHEVLEQIAADAGEEYIPVKENPKTNIPTKPAHCSQRDWDIEQSFIYFQKLHYPEADNPRPDCLTDDITVLPQNRFLRSVVQLWGSISPFNNKKQRFTYWMLYRYDRI